MDLIPCASAFMSNSTYKQYIDVVIHPYIYTYLLIINTIIIITTTIIINIIIIIYCFIHSVI